MIALRAAHTAIRVARDIGYPQIDVTRVYCQRCHAELDWQRLAAPPIHVMSCPTCGEKNVLPPYLRPAIQIGPPMFVPGDSETLAGRSPKHPPAPLPVQIAAWIFFIISMTILVLVARSGMR